jgi:transcriptional regulator with XRE-family HTH domain
MGEKNKHLHEPIGQRLRQAREKLKMPRTAMARALGLSDDTSLYKYEKGDRGMNVFQAVTAAQLLHVTTDWLLTGRESPFHPANAASTVSAAPVKGPAPTRPPELELAQRESPAARRSANARLQHAITTLSSAPDPEIEAMFKNFTNDDLDAIREHLDSGMPATAPELEIAVRARRMVTTGDADAVREFNAALARNADRRKLARPDTKGAQAPDSQDRRKHS